MALTSVLDYLPQTLPLTKVRTSESKTFTVIEHNDGSTSTEYVYELEKAPVQRVEDVVGQVNGAEYVFEQGTDYAVVDESGDGEPDHIDFSIGGVNPDANSTFEVTYVAQSILNRYVTAHDTVAAPIEEDVTTVIEARQVDHATGSELDRIGALFGELGKRRGRSDGEYRALLKSIVQSFSGQGTKPGMKFAIAAGIGTDTSNITINEDTQNVGYTVRVENTETGFVSSVINDMAQLADPSGVELLSPPVIVLSGETTVVDESGSTVAASSVGLGGQTLPLDGSGALGYQRALIAVATSSSGTATGVTSTTSSGTPTSSTGTSMTATRL